MVYKLIVTFERLSLPNFMARAQNIVSKLTSEPALTLFPEPWPASFPTRAQFTAGYTGFETAYNLALDGAKSAATTRDLKRAPLTTLLKDAAPYLESVAKTAGDVSMLDATGYGTAQRRGAQQRRRRVARPEHPVEPWRVERCHPRQGQPRPRRQQPRNPVLRRRSIRRSPRPHRGGCQQQRGEPGLKDSPPRRRGRREERRGNNSPQKESPARSSSTGQGKHLEGP